MLNLIMKQNVYRQRKLLQVDGTAVKEALRNGIGAEQVRGRIASGTLLTVPDHHVFNASCTSPDVQER